MTNDKQFDAPAALEQIVKGLQSEIVESGKAELCRVEDYKIVISLDNATFYSVTGNYNVLGYYNTVGAVGSGNTVNNGVNNGFMCGTSNEPQKVLLDIYSRLDAVGQARLITYATKLSRKVGAV
ncbi:MAG: hypothetical protein NC299_15275 [Lachnospiraceae bacterium]|nr:hypothetical protein [Lachnospiraceae bacterium]